MNVYVNTTYCVAWTVSHRRVNALTNKRNAMTAPHETYNLENITVLDFIYQQGQPRLLGLGQRNIRSRNCRMSWLGLPASSTSACQFTLGRQPNLPSGRLPGTRLQRAPQTSECLPSASEGRANSICRRSPPAQQCPQHHLPEWEEPRSAGVAGRNPQDGGTHHVPIRVPDSFSE
jgi:hypothetical protein